MFDVTESTDKSKKTKMELGELRTMDRAMKWQNALKNMWNIKTIQLHPHAKKHPRVSLCWSILEHKQKHLHSLSAELLKCHQAKTNTPVHSKTDSCAYCCSTIV